MKALHLIFSILLFFCFSLKAKEPFYERVYVHTDKDCYVAGEDILLKFYVVDNRFQPSSLSKVGYVEICNTEKPLMQLKVALEKGGGAGKISIPMNLPSGIYQLSGYTRYMRNEGEYVFFKNQIAIVNATQPTPDPKRFELVEKNEPTNSEKKESGNFLIKTDLNEYGNRQRVVLSIDNIPENTANLVVSVSRNDSIAFVPEIINHSEWLKQATNTSPLSQQWIPEYEGHIITGRFVPDPQGELLSNVALVGKNISYTSGQANAQNGTVNFYTSGIFGRQQIVTSAVSPFYEKAAYRIDLLTPFCASLPDSLPVLQIYPNEKQIMERYIGAQIQGKMNNDAIENFTQIFEGCTFQPTLSYDLDEYTRFNTVSETILEFISRVHVVKIRDKRRIGVFLTEYQRISPRTLVLLDGIPIYDHEDILNYNPMYIKKVDIYDERYMFGGKDFECIVSFITREGNLPLFQLSGESQLFSYDYPSPSPVFDMPDYSTDLVKNSRKPDFRHTLYWNPFVATNGQSANLSFYTSDLSGEFKVVVEGINANGEIIRGVSYFQVK
ncbi:MAG: hypothetical protein LBI82_03245 [Dysgonamonadaceae bacterium]|jgi:hypothetical protein|nr:hypothetical protein [Dysgonamonadaceae bacterium]